MLLQNNNTVASCWTYPGYGNWGGQYQNAAMGDVDIAWEDGSSSGYRILFNQCILEEATDSTWKEIY